MSPRSADDRFDSLLRGALRDPPPPRPGPGLPGLIVERAREWERGRAHRQSRSRRWALAAYWLATGLTSTAILASIPWPRWTPTALSEPSAWLFAAACAALLAPIQLFRSR
jgi:hypothetical protein